MKWGRSFLVPRGVNGVMEKFGLHSNVGKPLGFHIASSLDPTVGRHYQFNQRYDVEKKLYLFVTRNENRTISVPLSS